jgi:hypothetical protein
MAKVSTAISMDRSYQAEADVRTLIEAQVIKNDPKRFKAAQAKAKEQAKALDETFEDEANEPAGEDAAEGEKD